MPSLSALRPRIERLARLGVDDYRLVIRIGVLQSAFRLLKHVVPLVSLVQFARLRPVGSRQPARERRIAQLVDRISGLWRIGGTPTCLERSLVLYRLLSEANASPRLRIGVARVEGKVEGHAWVLVDGRPVGESEESLGRFTIVTSFDANGRVTHLDS